MAMVINGLKRSDAPGFHQGHLLCCRVDWIRTSDPLHPIQVRYRAAPPPEQWAAKVIENLYSEKKNLAFR